MATGKAGKKRGGKKTKPPAPATKKKNAKTQMPAINKKMAKATPASATNKKKKDAAHATAKKIIPSKESEHFVNPLAVEIPAIPQSYLSFECTKKILNCKRRQYFLWGAAVLFSIILLLAIASIKIGAEFGFLPNPSPLHFKAIEYADLLAIGILGIELFTGFRHAKNKLLFLKHNWLALIAIFPFGMFIRAGRVFEGLYLLEELSLLRPLQMAAKFRELQLLIPSLELPAEFALFDNVARSLLRTASRAAALFAQLMRPLYFAGSFFAPLARQIASAGALISSLLK